MVARFEFPNGQEGAPIAATLSIQAAGAHVPAQSVEQVWTFASHAACDAQPRDQAVDEAVGGIYAARARAEAVELNRHGDFAAAERTLKRVSERIRRYAGQSPALAQVVEALQEAAEVTSAPMSPLFMKSMHFEASSALRNRNAEGKARRRIK